MVYQEAKWAVTLTFLHWNDHIFPNSGKGLRSHARSWGPQSLMLTFWYLMNRYVVSFSRRYVLAPAAYNINSLNHCCPSQNRPRPSTPMHRVRYLIPSLRFPRLLTEKDQRQSYSLLIDSLRHDAQIKWLWWKMGCVVIFMTATTLASDELTIASSPMS